MPLQASEQRPLDCRGVFDWDSPEAVLKLAQISGAKARARCDQANRKSNKLALSGAGAICDGIVASCWQSRNTEAA